MHRCRSVVLKSLPYLVLSSAILLISPTAKKSYAQDSAPNFTVTDNLKAKFDEVAQSDSCSAMEGKDINMEFPILLRKTVHTNYLFVEFSKRTLAFHYYRSSPEKKSRKKFSILDFANSSAVMATIDVHSKKTDVTDATKLSCFADRKSMELCEETGEALSELLTAIIPDAGANSESDNIYVRQALICASALASAFANYVMQQASTSGQ